MASPSFGIHAEEDGHDGGVLYLIHSEWGGSLAILGVDDQGERVQQVIQDREIGFESMQERIDTTTHGGKRIFYLVGAFAEFERASLRARTRARLATAHAQASVPSPRATTATHAERARALRLDPKRTVRELCQTLQTSEATFDRYTAIREEEAHVDDTR